MRIGIIGGGPAGMMAAVSAAENIAEADKVLLFEKNRILGRKLRITGKGRCNLTNNCTPDEFISNVVTNRSFLYSAVNCFSSRDTMDFFERLGVKLKTERGKRVFPESDNAGDIAEALKNALKRSNISVINEKICKVKKLNSGFEICGEKEEHSVDRLIIATGGVSYPLTGSTGDGYKFAKQLGHSVTELSPALVPIEIKEKWAVKLAGLSLRNVRLECIDLKKNKCIYSKMGEMLFTHTGISGPIVLSLSSYLSNYNLNELKIYIDFKPALDEAKLDRRVLRDFDSNKNKSVENTLRTLLPKSLIDIVLKEAGICPTEKINQIKQEMRKKLINTVKSLNITPMKLGGFDEAVVTSGGINIREIQPKTMESKLVKGLYFAGEVIDVDALTGGFNLQIAFSTGWLAGSSAALSE